ncbi:MAG: ferrochelatase [Candidatus Binatia bacterium]
MAASFDAVLLLAFGGPTSAEEVRPFLARVLKGHPVPPQRIEEVVQHYEAVGGRSPLNEITFRQAKALEELLRERGIRLPVYVGMRHSSPFPREALERMMTEGIQRAIALILSPHQTEASWERYQKDLAAAQAEVGVPPEVDYCPGWHDHPLLIQTWAEQIEAALAPVSDDKRETTPLIFTAHSIPTEMAARSPYVSQIKETARLIAERLGHRRWSVAYQSRSGRAGESWLEPDIAAAIRRLAAEGVKEVVVAPIGFVSDHVEILYDIDIDARRIAEGMGMRFLRANSPNDHPTFIRMMAEVIEKRMKSAEDRE